MQPGDDESEIAGSISDHRASRSKHTLEPHQHASLSQCIGYSISHPAKVFRCKCGRWQRQQSQTEEVPMQTWRGMVRSVETCVHKQQQLRHSTRQPTCCSLMSKIHS